MENEERLTFESANFEDQLESVRDFVNKNRDVAIEALNKIEALTEILKEKNYLPPAYPPKAKYPKITTKEACEKAGGEWDEEKKTCKLPPKKKETTESQLGILPTTNQSNVEAQAIALAKKIGRR